jgi:hypothetical protein
MVAIITPYTKGAGYYRNDDQASGGKLLQADVQTCSHCQKVLMMQQWSKDGAICGGRCHRPLCDGCAMKIFKGAECLPFEDWLHQQLEKAERRAQYRRVAGI